MAEGLLSEVTALLGARLTVKAADQAYFGGKQVYTNVSNAASTSQEGGKGKESEHGGAVQQAIAKAKQIVDQALGGVPVSADSGHIVSEIESLKKENASIRDELKSLREIIAKLEKVHLTASSSAPAPAAAAAPAKEESPAKEGDDDFDLFGSEDEEEDEEKKKLVEERLKAYAEKKSKKPGPIAKSSVILDVKPWDDETDLKEMEEKVRGIQMDGLIWGGAKQIAIGYGISKLQIISVIEDLKVSVDDLIDTITAFEDHVQSVDIVAFNKI